jgi:hypothetical protein
VLTIKAIEEYCDEPLLELNEIEKILQSYKMRFIMDGEREVLGRLIVKLK